MMLHATQNQELAAAIDSQYSDHATVDTREQPDISHLSEDFQPLDIGSQPPLQQTVGEIDPLGFHVKDVISSINRLEGLGLQRQQIPLPKIIVLGEQSTGKSSVIEAISGIKTPRSTGTCTRCPLFIKLEAPSEPDATWVAHVTLRRGFAYDGKVGKVGKSHERRFPGWTPLPQPTTVEFATTQNPNELEQIIARAQLAIISPLVDHTEFLKTTLPNLDNWHRCGFSPNIVSIFISNPGLPALSFYDLPGIIGQSEDPVEVEFVRNLVADYIKDPEALILVACSLETDIANSTAGGIARELQATDRCIGTRPEQLRAIFDHKRYALGHGYFVVRNLSQDQLDDGQTHQHARQQEEQFFSHEKFWATDLKDYESQFGTVKLQNFLSRKLAEQIVKKLPIIQNEINNRLQEVDDTLQQYPAPPTRNPTRIIFDIVQSFSARVREDLEGHYPNKSWRTQWEGLQSAFFDSLVTLKPTMVTVGVKDRHIYSEHCALLRASSGKAEISMVIISDDEEEEDAVEDATLSTPNPSPKKRKLEDSPASSAVNVRSSKAFKDAMLPTDFSNMKMKFQLDELEQYLNENSRSIVPDKIDPRVTHDLMIKALGKWQLPIDDFFLQFETRLRKHVRDTFRQEFGKWEGTALYTEADKIVTDMLNLNLEQQRTTMVKESLDDEKEGPYIFNNDLFSNDKQVVLHCYQQARFKARFALYKKQRQQRTGRDLSHAEEAKLMKDESLMVILRKEPYKKELDTTADVSTYYMLATRRFHNSVCMRIISKFFKQLRSQLQDELENRLGIVDGIEGHENAMRLLAEKSQREVQRQELVARKNALMQGKQILFDLQLKKYNEHTVSQTCRIGMINDSGHNMFGIPTPHHEEMEEDI
ncbi:P-loop containing nucleoside triphosphate hydrolase protein [Phaeosphaeriaceae sp. PMI808]|nr:P-loop containing nucleoside triphosphate hydrolase protein [Phaeosphaeriaceae sp. PMI808]